MRRWRDPDEGREWEVTLEAPGKVLSVPPDMHNAGARLPEDAIRIVFRSGDEQVDEEYTGLVPPEEMEEKALARWWRSARKGEGL